MTEVTSEQPTVKGNGLDATLDRISLNLQIHLTPLPDTVRCTVNCWTCQVFRDLGLYH